MLNARLAEEQKQMGLDLVETSNPTFIETMRAQARRIARERGEVCADDLREWLETEGKRRGVPVPTSMNAMGAIFRGKEWVFVRFTKSRQVQGHKNLIRVWRLADPNQQPAR